MPVFTRPSDFIAWCTAGSASEPAGGKKAVGWIVEKPPYQYMNWLFKTLDEWTKYHDEANEGIVGIGTGPAGGLIVSHVATTQFSVSAGFLYTSEGHKAILAAPDTVDASTANAGPNYRVDLVCLAWDGSAATLAYHEDTTTAPADEYPLAYIIVAVNVAFTVERIIQFPRTSAMRPVVVVLPDGNEGEQGGDFSGATGIQAAVTYLRSVGGGKIFLAPGHYHVFESINLGSNIEIIGNGLSVIEYEGGTALFYNHINSGRSTITTTVGTGNVTKTAGTSFATLMPVWDTDGSGAVLWIEDGNDAGWYRVQTVGGATALTVKNLDGSDVSFVGDSGKIAQCFLLGVSLKNIIVQVLDVTGGVDSFSLIGLYKSEVSNIRIVSESADCRDGIRADGAKDTVFDRLDISGLFTGNAFSMTTVNDGVSIRSPFFDGDAVINATGATYGAEVVGVNCSGTMTLTNAGWIGDVERAAHNMDGTQADDSVDTDAIVNDAVDEDKIADNAVRTDHIAANNVLGTKVFFEFANLLAGTGPEQVIADGDTDIVEFSRSTPLPAYSLLAYSMEATSAPFRITAKKPCIVRVDFNIFIEDVNFTDVGDNIFGILVWHDNDPSGNHAVLPLAGYREAEVALSVMDVHIHGSMILNLDTDDYFHVTVSNQSGNSVTISDDSIISIQEIESL